MQWEMGAQEVVRWQTTLGPWEGILIKPARYVPGHKYPLIVDTYPAPVSFNEFYGGTNAAGASQLLAAAGYAVLLARPRAPHIWSNLSREHDRLAARGPKGIDRMVDDVMSGVDEVIKRGIVDQDRMCLLGMSNGGAVINQLVTKTQRFKCAVSIAGAVSVDWSLPVFLWTDAQNIAELAGATPWESPQTYFELSAIYRLKDVTTPMLLADGDRDSGFILGSIEMYNGLRYLGKPVTFLRYPNQGHVLDGAAAKDLRERSLEFFAKYLKPDSDVSARIQ